MASRNTSSSTSSSSSSSKVSSSSKSSSSRTSIHTPLKPASVQDLKARFDPSKMSSASESSGSTGSGLNKLHTSTSSPRTDRRDPQRSSFGKGPTAGKSATLSTVNSSLLAAANRKLGSENNTLSSSSSSSLSSSTSSNAHTTSKTSSLSLISPRPFSPPSSSSSNAKISTPSFASSLSSLSSSSSSSSSSTVTNAKTPRSSNVPSKGSSNSSSTSSSLDGVRGIFEKSKESSRVEIPVTHVTSSKTKTKGENKTTTDLHSDNKLRDSDTDDKFKKPATFQSRAGVGQKLHEAKSVFGEGIINSKGSPKGSPKASPRSEKQQKFDPASPPVQRTKRLVAREITIERLDTGENVTSYKDFEQTESKPGIAVSDDISSTTANQSKPGPGTKTTTGDGTGTKIREIKVQRLPPSAKPEKDLPFKQVKLRNTKLQIEKQASTDSLKSSSELNKLRAATDTDMRRQASTDSLKSSSELKLRVAADTDMRRQASTDSLKSSSELKLRVAADTDMRRISRKISSERFERLMFDFERGVPTDADPRDESENPDHIELQQKARELPILEKSAGTPIIVKKNKEESIFKEGLKVSDFVKQVNKMNPEVSEPPKWKVQQKVYKSQTSSTASSDVGGDNFYQGIPGEEEEEEAHEADLEDDEDDIYEKVNIQVPLPDEPNRQNGGSSPKPPSRRLGVYRRQKSKGSKKEDGKSSKNQPKEVEIQEVVIHSDGEDGWDIGDDSSSAATDYEDVGQDAEAEDEDFEEDLYEVLENFSKPASKGNTLTHKLKKIFVNKKKKTKQVADPTASTGTATDSEGDFIDDATDDPDGNQIGSLSRSSSERSSGRLARDNTNTTGSIPTTNSSTAITASSSATDDATSGGSVNNAQQQTGQNAPTASMASSNSNPPPPPPLPPRASRNLNTMPENSPPLPPRNPSLSHKGTTLGVPLDMVIPVSPTSKSGSAYRQGDKKKDRFSFGANSQEGSDSGISSCKLEYIDYDPASAQTLERIEKRKSASASNRPVSAASSGSSSNSSYMYPDMSALSDLHGENGENESLYVDLEDEQIYGKASDMYVSKFESEPLYQWYSKDKMMQSIRGETSSASGDLSDEEYLELESNGGDSVYEDVERLLEKNLAPPTNSSKSSSQDKKEYVDNQKPQRRSIIEDVFTKGGTLHRALWCQMPEVLKSGLLEKLSDQDKKIQEAMFEIMTSEASYLKSLNILISVFLMAPEFSGNMTDRCVITRRDRTILFSNIGNIRDISAKFLADLEARWQESCYMKDVCDIIVKHSTKSFEPYVRYCCNQTFQDRALTALKQNAEFNEAVKRLEMRPECQFLPLASFLLLPMQRITRLPLLVDAICHRLEAGSAHHASAKKGLESLTKVAKRCDEAAKKMQQTEQMYHLNQNLEFKIKEIPLVSASRFLVKQGELTLIKSDSGTVRKPLSKLLGSNKEHVYLYLFNDILLVTKKKGSIYQVRDYCQRNSLHAEAIDNPDKTRHVAANVMAHTPNVMLLAMLANHDNKQVELVISCKSESERARWVDAIMPTQSSSDNERIYDFWDCPQHQCVIKYLAQQPDELTLEESDVVNVTRKMKDGWYEGERIRDGMKGWFLASHTEEINNSHVRARNLRLRYRLMIASDAFQAERDKR